MPLPVPIDLAAQALTAAAPAVNMAPAAASIAPLALGGAAAYAGSKLLPQLFNSLAQASMLKAMPKVVDLGDKSVSANIAQLYDRLAASKQLEQLSFNAGVYNDDFLSPDTRIAFAEKAQQLSPINTKFFKQDELGNITLVNPDLYNYEYNDEGSDLPTWWERKPESESGWSVEDEEVLNHLRDVADYRGRLPDFQDAANATYTKILTEAGPDKWGNHYNDVHPYEYSVHRNTALGRWLEQRYPFYAPPKGGLGVRGSAGRIEALSQDPSKGFLYHIRPQFTWGNLDPNLPF